MLPRYTLHLLVEYVPHHHQSPLWRRRDRSGSWLNLYMRPASRRPTRTVSTTPKGSRRMLAQDLRILEEQPRWPKFINRLAGALPDGSGTEAIVEAIRHEMLPMYRLLSQCMEYYGYR